MNRKVIFEDLATAQVSRTQSRRIRLEPDGKQQEQRSLMVIYDKQKNNYLYDLNSFEIWNRETYTWNPSEDYLGQIFYTVDNQSFYFLGEVEVKDKRDVGEDGTNLNIVSLRRKYLNAGYTFLNNKGAIVFFQNIVYSLFYKIEVYCPISYTTINSTIATC